MAVLPHLHPSDPHHVRETEVTVWALIVILLTLTCIVFIGLLGRV